MELKDKFDKKIIRQNLNIKSKKIKKVTCLQLKEQQNKKHIIKVYLKTVINTKIHVKMHLKEKEGNVLSNQNKKIWNKQPI